MGGSVGLIIGNSVGGFDDDFFIMGLLQWRCFSFGLVLVLLGIFDSLGFKSMVWVSDQWLRYFWVFSTFSGLIIGLFLGILDGLGFKSTTWVSDQWLGFAD